MPSAVMALLVLFFQCLFTFDLSKLCCIGAMLLPTFFAVRFQVVF